MCLITTWKRAKRATEDMTVYKLLNRDYTSFFERFLYKKEKLYTAKMNRLADGGYLDDREFRDVYGLPGPKWYIETGFHTAATKERLENIMLGHLGIIVKCTIPKGSLYYKNESDLLVSNQIIVH